MSRHAGFAMMLLTSIFVFSGTARSESWRGAMKTVAFKTVEGQPLELDIYYPETEIKEPAPAHALATNGTVFMERDT